MAAIVAAAIIGGGGARAGDPLPVPWNGMDIGDPVPAGSARLDNGIFTMTAGGSGILDASDQFHFAYQPVTGDFALIARVAPPFGNGNTVAGLMVRDALATTSDFVSIAQTPGDGIVSQFRTSYAAQVGTATAGASGPLWIRLIKRRTTVETYLAPDAHNTPGTWKKVGKTQPIGSGMIYAGFYLTGHSQGVSSQATFDHVSMVTSPQPLLEDGTYTIVPASAPALVLGAVSIEVRLAPPARSPRQQWVVTGKDSGFYAIHPAQDTSLALAVAGGGSVDGTKIVLQADQGLPAQRWSIVANSNGTYGLVPQCAPGRGLDDFAGNATPDARIDLWSRWNGDPHTQWTFVSVQ